MGKVVDKKAEMAERAKKVGLVKADKAEVKEAKKLTPKKTK